MSIMNCNFVKTQAFPLVFRVSSQPKSFNLSHRFKASQLISDGFYPKPSERCFSNGVFQKPLQVVKDNGCFSCGFHFENALQSSKLMRIRNFSNGSPQRVWEGDRGGVKSRRNLPWISAYKNKGGGKSLDKAKPKGASSTSPWEESAKTFLMDHGLVEPVDDRRNTMRTVEREDVPRDDSRGRNERWVNEERTEEGSEEAVVKDPRWDRIQTRYRRMTDAEAGPEKPEMQRWNKQENWGRRTWKEATETPLPKMTGEGVYGVGPVLAALSAGRREFYALYVQEGLDLSSNNRKKKDKKGFEKVLRIAEKIGLTIKKTSKHDLNMLVDSRPHQGLMLDASPLEMVKIQELEPVSVEGEQGPLWVALDEVTDPQNLGAIVRSSYFFGAAGVVLCAKNSAPLSGVVSKASAGSLELMELRSCKNMMQFLTRSTENGWRVLGGSVSSRALPLNEIPAGAPTILVLGSEGTGLRPLVERSCTELVRIPGNIPIDISAGGIEDETNEEVDRGCSGEEFRSFLAVESLNVSVAAGVLLHHLIGNNNNCHLGDKQETLLD